MADTLLRASSTYANPYEKAYDYARYNRNFNQKMWEQSFLMGDQDRYLQLLRETNETDLRPEYYDPLYYNYEGNMLMLAESMADDKIIEDHSELKDNENYQQYVDRVYGTEASAEIKNAQLTAKQYLGYIIDQDIEARRIELDYLYERNRKEAMTGWSKWWASAWALNLEIGEGAIRGIAAFVDAIGGLAIATESAIGEGKNWFDAYAEYFDQGALAAESGLGKALAEYERKHTYFRTTDGELTTSGKYLGQTSNAIGYMILSIVLAYVTGGASIGAVSVGNLAFYTQIFAQNVYENQTNFATRGSPGWMKVTNAFTQAVSEAAIEWSLGKVIGLVGKGIGLSGRTTVDIMRGAGASTGKAANLGIFVERLNQISGAKGWIKGIELLGAEAAQEGLEEFLQDLGDMCINYFYGTLKNGEGYGKEGFDFQTLTDSFITGALMSLVMAPAKPTFFKVASAVDRKMFSKEVSRFDTFGVTADGQIKKLGIFQNVAYNNLIDSLQQDIKMLKNTKIGEGNRAEIMTDIESLYNLTTQLGQLFDNFDEKRLENVQKFFNYIKDHKTLTRTGTEDLRQEIESRMIVGSTITDAEIADSEKYIGDLMRRHMPTEDVTVAQNILAERKALKAFAEEAEKKGVDRLVRERQQEQVDLFVNEAHKQIDIMLSGSARAKYLKDKIDATKNKLKIHESKGGNNSIAEASMSTVHAVVDNGETTAANEKIDERLKTKARKKLEALQAEYNTIFVTDGNDAFADGRTVYMPIEWLENYPVSEIYKYLSEQKILETLLDKEALNKSPKAGQLSFFDQLIEVDANLRGVDKATINKEQAFMDFLFNPSVYTDMLFNNEGKYFRENIKDIVGIFGTIEELAAKSKIPKAYNDVMAQLRQTMRIPTIKAIMKWPELWRQNQTLGLYKLLAEQDRELVNKEIKRQTVLATGLPRNAFEFLTKDTLAYIEEHEDLQNKSPKMYDLLQKYKNNEFLDNFERAKVVAYIHIVESYKGWDIRTTNMNGYKYFYTIEDEFKLKYKSIESLSKPGNVIAKEAADLMYDDMITMIKQMDHLSNEERDEANTLVLRLSEALAKYGYNIIVTGDVDNSIYDYSAELRILLNIENANNIYDEPESDTNLVVPAKAFYLRGGEQNPDTLAIDEIVNTFEKIYGNLNSYLYNTPMLNKNFTIEELGQQMIMMQCETFQDFAVEKINDMLFGRFKDQRYFIEPRRGLVNPGFDTEKAFKSYSSKSKLDFGLLPIKTNKGTYIKVAGTDAFVPLTAQFIASIDAPGNKINMAELIENGHRIAYNLYILNNFLSGEKSNEIFDESLHSGISYEKLIEKKIAEANINISFNNLQEMKDFLIIELTKYLDYIMYRPDVPDNSNPYLICEGIPVSIDSLTDELKEQLTTKPKNKEDLYRMFRNLIRKNCVLFDGTDALISTTIDYRNDRYYIVREVQSAQENGVKIPYDDIIFKADDTAITNRDTGEILYMLTTIKDTELLYGINKKIFDKKLNISIDGLALLDSKTDEIMYSLTPVTLQNNILYKTLYKGKEQLKVKDIFKEDIVNKLYNVGGRTLQESVGDVEIYFEEKTDSAGRSYAGIQKIGIGFDFAISTLCHEINHQFADINMFYENIVYPTTADGGFDVTREFQEACDDLFKAVYSLYFDTMTPNASLVNEVANDIVYYMEQTERLARTKQVDRPIYISSHRPMSAWNPMVGPYGVFAGTATPETFKGSNANVNYTQYVIPVHARDYSRYAEEADEYLESRAQEKRKAQEARRQERQAKRSTPEYREELEQKFAEQAKVAKPVPEKKEAKPVQKKEAPKTKSVTNVQKKDFATALASILSTETKMSSYEAAANREMFHDAAISEEVVKAFDVLVDKSVDTFTKNKLTIDDLIKNPDKYLAKRLKKELGDKIKDEGYMYSVLSQLMSRSFKDIGIDVYQPGDANTAQYIFVNNKAFDDILRPQVLNAAKNNGVTFRNKLLNKQDNGETVTLADVYHPDELELMGIPTNIPIIINSHSRGGSYFEVTREHSQGVIHISFMDRGDRKVTDGELLNKINHEFRHVLQAYNRMSQGFTDQFVVTNDMLADMKRHAPDLFNNYDIRKIFGEKANQTPEQILEVDKKIARAFVYLFASGEINARNVSMATLGIKPVFVSPAVDGKVKVFMPWYDAETKDGMYDIEFTDYEAMRQRSSEEYQDLDEEAKKWLEDFDGEESDELTEEEQKDLPPFNDIVDDLAIDRLLKEGKKPSPEIANELLKVIDELEQNYTTRQLVNMWKEIKQPVNEPVVEPQTTSIDAEYMQLAQDPKKNENKLKELVEQAAKTAFPESIRIRDGKFYPVWHHTKATFTTFLPGLSPDPSGVKGIFFAPNEHGNISSSFGDGKPYYLNVKKVVVSGTKEGNSIVEELKKEQKDVTSREEIAKINQDFSKRTGIDAIVDPLNGWFTVLSADIIKSADPIVYDDKGNIIPLSERFNLQVQIDDDVTTIIEEQEKLDEKVKQILETEAKRLEEDPGRAESKKRLTDLMTTINESVSDKDRAKYGKTGRIHKKIPSIVNLKESVFAELYKYGSQLSAYDKKKIADEEVVKQSRYVSKKGYENTNLKYYFEKGKPVQMSNVLRDFIVATTGQDDDIDPVIMNAIKKGKLTQQRLLSYFASTNFGKDATKEQGQNTFELINDKFFDNKKFKSLNDVDVFTISTLQEAWALAITMARYDYSMGEFLKDNDLAQFEELLDNALLSDIKEVVEAQSAFFTIVRDQNGRTQQLAPSDKLNAQMRLYAMRYFDGTISSAYYIATLARRALIEENKMSLVSLDKQVEGKDGSSTTFGDMLFAKKLDKNTTDIVDNLYDYYIVHSAPIDDDLDVNAKINELEKIYITAIIDNLRAENPDMTESQIYRSFAKEIIDLGKKYRKSLETKQALNPASIDKIYSEIVLSATMENTEDVVYTTLQASQPSRTGIQHRIQSTAERLLKYIREKKISMSSLDENIQAMFEKNSKGIWVLKDSVYKLGKGRQKGDIADLNRESYARDVSKIKENADMLTDYYNKLKSRHKTDAEKLRERVKKAEASKKEYQELDKQQKATIKLLRKQIKDLEAGKATVSTAEVTITPPEKKPARKKKDTSTNQAYRSENLTIASFGNRALPTALASILQTSFTEFADNQVQFISKDVKTGEVYDKEKGKDFKSIEEHEVTSLDKFMSLNIGILSEMTISDVLEIVQYFKDGVFVMNGDARKFAAFEVFTLAYIVGNMHRGVWALSETDMKTIEKLYEDVAGMFGTGLRAIGQVQEMVNPYKYLVARLQEYGVELEDITPLQQSIERFNKAETKEEQLTLAKLINAQLSDIETRMVQPKIKKSEKFLAYSYMSKLSSPVTWARNIVTNVEMTAMNIVSDGLMNKVLTGLGKKAYRTDLGQIDLASVKATQEVRDWVNENILKNPMFIRMFSGYTKYDPKFGVAGEKGFDIKYTDAEGKVKTAHLNSLINILAESMVSDFRATHKFIDEDSGTLDKAMQICNNFITKMISDERFIKFATGRYFSKLLQIRVNEGFALNDTTILTESVLKDFVESIRLAAADYMHKPSVMADLQAWLKREHPTWSYGFSLLMPFVNSSLNFFTEGLKMTPIGLAVAIKRFCNLEAEIEKRQKLRGEAKGKALTDDRFMEFLIRRDIGKGIIGTLGLIAGALLTAFGIVRIREENDKYKMIIGDMSVDISAFLGTSSFITGMAVISNMQNRDEKKWYQILEKSFIATFDALSEGFPLRDVYDRYNFTSTFGEAVLTFSDNFFRGFVPQALQFFTTATRMYNVKYSNGLKGKIQKFVDSFLPFMTAGDWVIDPYTGKKQSKWAIPIVSYGMKSLLGVYWTTPSEGQKLSESLGVNKKPLTGKITVNGKSVQLDYTIVNEKYGELNKASLANIAKQKYSVQMENGTYKTLSWSAMTDKQKANVLNRIYDHNADVARIYAWTQAGHKYYTGKDYLQTLKKAGVKNVYYGDKGFVE